LVAAGSNFYAAWTDTRNRCTPPGGAPRPCSPASPTSRGDQDVFFSVNSDPAGPDLAITPWGSVTGHGPTWQSPDIFVVDNGNNVVNAKPGAMNRLRARIRNVGNAAANGATVRFKYAPYFIGLTAAGFKEIAAPTVSLAAAGDASGSDLMAVPAQWDLTNPAENNGGIWPMPISAFQHFCVKVDVELSADVNQSNNTAQTNFVDLTADCCRPFRFLVGNPFRGQDQGFYDTFGDVRVLVDELLRANERAMAQETRQLAVDKPTAIADLKTTEGAALVDAKWFVQPAHIKEASFKSPGPSSKDPLLLYPTGMTISTHTIHPQIGATDFDKNFIVKLMSIVQNFTPFNDVIIAWERRCRFGSGLYVIIISERRDSKKKVFLRVV